MSKRSKASQRTSRQKFVHYLQQMLRWQSLPRGSVERAQKFAEWLEQGQHTGGKPAMIESATDEGRKKKGAREGWKFGWRKRIQRDVELVKMADEAGVLDTPRPDALPGDFANPDPRVYRAIRPQPIPENSAPRDPVPEVRSTLRRAWERFVRAPRPLKDE